jgi:hypothetical protein
MVRQSYTPLRVIVMTGSDPAIGALALAGQTAGSRPPVKAREDRCKGLPHA